MSKWIVRANWARLCMVVLLAVLWPWQAAFAAEGLLATQTNAFNPITMEAGRPKFFIPPDSRLARNEHPRFLLTKEDLETLRRRVADPRLAADFAALKRQAERPWETEGGGWKHALLWKLTGERIYLEAIRRSPEFQKPSWVLGWPATMDLIWQDLTAAERAELSDRVAQAVAPGGVLYWRATLPLVSVFYEGGPGRNDAVLRARLQRDFDETLVQWTDKLNRWSAGRGGSDMSHGYNGEHAYWEPFSAAIAWSHATGEDYLGRAAFSKYQSAFYWYHFLPNLHPLTVEKIGVTRTADDPSAVTPAHSGANHLLFLTFARENDGLGLAWMELFHAQEPAWNRDREALGRVLWWNPDRLPLDPATLPTTRLFPTSGHVVMRSDWSDNATFATFRCGRFGEIDGGWGRNNADNLSFTLRKRGPLAIDSGPVHGQNTTVLKFLGEGSDSDVPAIGNYGRQTIAHNSITVGEDEFEHHDWRGQPTREVVRRGGQSVPQAKDWWGQRGFAAPQRDFMQGRITAYRTHPLYDYACGDARFSYPPEWGLEEITRQFVFLKPDIFVVYDRLVLANPARKPCWMLHSLREPKADGTELPLTSAEVGPQFLWDGKAKVPHPAPGGHFWMAGDGFTVESGSPGSAGAGWLAVRTFAPATSDCERKKIGGRNHDFEVAGVQYGLTDEGYRMAEDGYAVRSTIGLLGWRVELRPKTPSKTVEFLHVMQVGTGGQTPETVRGATQEMTPDARVITLQQGERRFVLTLQRTGPRGGSIAVQDAQVHVTDPLPDTIEDHWRAFKDDPYFKAWVSDPRYRAVIEPTAEDRQCAAASHPPSPVIASITWAPTNTIRRAAPDSDRFTLTWADDEAQYTGWGDGHGFQKTREKLGLGFARITGSAENFTGQDVRSPTGENTGSGRHGLKGSGLLSVGGVLYLWAGNASLEGAQSRLAWSADHARTWTWADWKFDEFGYISLLNFGKDYAGARDGFVYAIAHDHPSAYVPADRFILMRVPRERLRDRAAYEFWSRGDESGQPAWSREITQRGTMFANPGRCLRQQMTYCAPLKRYLWWQQRPGVSQNNDRADTRFQGGFAIYDAPQPWGPWTTAYATDRWDVGPGETGSFPTQWMSADGKTLQLVFSGDDSCSVRRATVSLRPAGTR